MPLWWYWWSENTRRKKIERQSFSIRRRRRPIIWDNLGIDLDSIGCEREPLRKGNFPRRRRVWVTMCSNSRRTCGKLSPKAAFLKQVVNNKSTLAGKIFAFRRHVWIWGAFYGTQLSAWERNATRGVRSLWIHGDGSSEKRRRITAMGWRRHRDGINYAHVTMLCYIKDEEQKRREYDGCNPFFWRSFIFVLGGFGWTGAVGYSTFSVKGEALNVVVYFWNEFLRIFPYEPAFETVFRSRSPF